MLNLNMLVMIRMILVSVLVGLTAARPDDSSNPARVAKNVDAIDVAIVVAEAEKVQCSVNNSSCSAQSATISENESSVPDHISPELHSEHTSSHQDQEKDKEESAGVNLQPRFLGGISLDHANDNNHQMDTLTFNINGKPQDQDPKGEGSASDRINSAVSLEPDNINVPQDRMGPALDTSASDGSDVGHADANLRSSDDSSLHEHDKNCSCDNMSHMSNGADPRFHSGSVLSIAHSSIQEDAKSRIGPEDPPRTGADISEILVPDRTISTTFEKYADNFQEGIKNVFKRMIQSDFTHDSDNHFRTGRATTFLDEPNIENETMKRFVILEQLLRLLSKNKDDRISNRNDLYKDDRISRNIKREVSHESGEESKPITNFGIKK